MAQSNWLALKTANGWQAYDGHMNLILSDVEETIMIVETPDGTPQGRGTVNVSTPTRLTLG
jgi:small nuclear ribonucleoprotein (snRNP)-like protein